jgi:hypothetical protein
VQQESSVHRWHWRRDREVREPLGVYFEKEGALQAEGTAMQSPWEMLRHGKWLMSERSVVKGPLVVTPLLEGTHLASLRVKWPDQTSLSPIPY